MRTRFSHTLLSIASLLTVSQVAAQVAAAPPAAVIKPAAATNGAAPQLIVTRPVDLSGRHDLPSAETVRDDAAAQLKGLCSLADFCALPEVDRHVYAFDVWPGEKENLGGSAATFNFHLGPEKAMSLGLGFLPSGGGPGGSHMLARANDGASSRKILSGFGNLDWSGVSQHAFTFNKPVKAFGVVLKSSGDFELRKFYWPAAHDRNGYPVSYTLSDGSVVQLGTNELRGAQLSGGTNTFIGVIDRSGRGIVSVAYTIRGLAGNKAQSICLCDWVFATMPRPARAAVIALRSACDFDDPQEIVAAPAVAGLASLADFRFIARSHRFVYNFDTWPQTSSSPEAQAFCFDLTGKGTTGQTVTVTARCAGRDVKPAQATVRDQDGLAYHVLGGLGDIGKGVAAEQTLTFQKPVWGCGITYRATRDLQLGGVGAAAVSYTLADGTMVQAGAAGGMIAGHAKPFVGVIDQTDKGIASITFRVQGTADAPQPVTIEDLAFALAGPPPGTWTMTMHDEFEGNKLNPAFWTAGYTFPDVINNELQGYVPENVTVSNGICTIKVERRDCVNTDRTGRKGAAQKFASGAFTSFDKFAQTYGYFEARVKMTKAPGAGTWPAFWMLPDRGRDFPEPLRRSYGTKDYGRGIEIDIFEFMPWWKTLEGRFYCHVGCIWSYGKVTDKDPAPHGYGSYALDNDGWGPAELTYPEADTQFHTYGLYWSPERLIYYLDGKPVFRVKDARHVPDVPHYFLFNVALSGNGWGKSPDKKHPSYQQIVDDMPNRMEIDYFRVYAGVLDEAVPPAPTDLPTARRTYTPPPKNAPAPTPAPALIPAPATPPLVTPADGVPHAPANSQITSPANG